MKNYISTVDLPHEEWLNLRRTGIGGSDVAAILGLSPFSTPLDVYYDKIGTADPITDTPKMKAGRMLETIIADYYAEETGKKAIHENKLLEHSEVPFLLANRDRIILPQNGEGRGVLECKNVGEFYFKSWGDEIPEYMYCQLMHYLDPGFGPIDWGELAIFVGGWDFHRFPFNRDEEFIKLKNERLIDFWENNVLKEIPPAPINIDDINKLFPNSVEEKTHQANVSTYSTYKELKKKQEEIKILKEEENSLKTAIQIEMEDSEKLAYGEDLLVTWRNSKDSIVVDSKKLKAEAPEIYNAFSKTKKGSRRFLIK